MKEAKYPTERDDCCNRNNYGGCHYGDVYRGFCPTMDICPKEVKE